MPLEALKSFRFLIPAVLLYLLLVQLCWASHWCSLAMPESYDAVTKSFLAIVLGIAYYFLPLREWANRSYLNRVNRNLVDQLMHNFVNDSGVPKNLSWEEIKGVFYHYVDTEQDLAHLRSLAFWNGAFWTSAADVRSIASVGVVLLAFMMLCANLLGSSIFDNARATYVFMLLTALLLLSIYLSEVTTRRQISIGTQQAVRIRNGHSDDLKARLIAAAKK